MFRHVLCVYPYRRTRSSKTSFPPLGLEYVAAAPRRGPHRRRARPRSRGPIHPARQALGRLSELKDSAGRVPVQIHLRSIVRHEI